MEKVWSPSPLQYYNMLKDARTHYFSNPRFVFMTVNQLVTPPLTVPIGSDAACDNLSYFTDQVESIKASITPNATSLMSFTCNKIV